VHTVLPGTADLEKEMEQQLDKSRQELQDLARGMNNLRNMSTSQLYSDSSTGNVIEIEGSYKARQIQDLIDKYEKLTVPLATEMQHGLRLGNVTAHLGDSFDEVLAAIKSVTDALRSMIGAFADLVNNLKSIDDSLTSSAGASANPVEFKRRTVIEHLEHASQNTWPLVANLARQFEENGLPLTRPVGREALREFSQQDSVEILGSNYGGSDVTHYSKLLFNFCPNIKIRSFEPGFPEAWFGTIKSISVLHRCGDSLRIFVCREYSGVRHEHVLRIGSRQVVGFRRRATRGQVLHPSTTCLR